MKRLNYTGAAILMVFFFSAIATTMLTAAWRTITYAMEASCMRLRRNQYIIATQGLLRCAVELCIENYGIFVTSQHEEMLEYPDWLKLQNSSYLGIISFKSSGTSVAVNAVLQNNKGSGMCHIQCKVKNTDQGSYEIYDWTIKS
jgi:hypothetical protein